MSTSIYRPYFYIIQHINSGKYYAGVKYAENANPDTLLHPNGYQTSSPVVKQIIFEEGLESFIIRKIKVFETGEQALEYESRFLRRVNASFNESFLNRSNNSIGSLNVDSEKRKQTCLDRYGVENPFQNEEIKEKIKQTCLEKYGVEYISQSAEMREKYKQTNLEKYGSSKSEEIKEKKKHTCLGNFGCENPFQNEEIKEKIKQSNLEKYGVEFFSQTEEVKQKYKESCLAKYGVEYAFQAEQVKEKIKLVLLEKYDVEYISQSVEIREKIKQTILSKYGYENISQSPEIKEKKRQTFIALKNRPTVLEIMKYKENFNPNLPHHWYHKKQDIVDDILDQLKIIYGKLD